MQHQLHRTWPASAVHDFYDSRYQFLLHRHVDWGFCIYRGQKNRGFDVRYLGMPLFIFLPSPCMEENRPGHRTGGIKKVHFSQHAWSGKPRKRDRFPSPRINTDAFFFHTLSFLIFFVFLILIIDYLMYSLALRTWFILRFRTRAISASRLFSLTAPFDKGIDSGGCIITNR